MKLSKLTLSALLLAAAVAVQSNSFQASAAGAEKKKTSSSAKKSGGIRTIYTSPDGKEWVHEGNRHLFVTKDSLGIVRCMKQYTGKPITGTKYCEAVSEYARRLKDDNVRVYWLLAPSQGEFYMPEPVSTQGAEQASIATMATYLDPLVTPVQVCDTLRAHADEKIYSYTDHHWAPLGAYYASKVFAEAAGVPFRPLSDYTVKEVKDYVGSMYSFSGDPAVKNNPETFVYFMPPEGYETESIKYNVSNGKTVSENAPEKRSFFRDYPDGSGGAYCTFMGGDRYTVKVTESGGTPGRKLLIVKDSYGNAMAPTLFGSFEEVHVIDFRYFPHGLLDYVRKHGITDLLFENSLSIATNPNTANRLSIMMK